MEFIIRYVNVMRERVRVLIDIELPVHSLEFPTATYLSQGQYRYMKFMYTESHEHCLWHISQYPRAKGVKSWYIKVHIDKTVEHSPY